MTKAELDTEGTEPDFEESVLREIASLAGIPPLELIEIFLDDARNYLQEIQCAMPAGDRATVNRHSHSMKSAAASIGAMRVAACSRRLETATQVVLDVQSFELFDAMRLAFAKFEAIIQANAEMLRQV